MMTTCAASTILLLAVLNPPKVTGNLFPKESADYKDLVEKLATKIAGVFWPAGRANPPHIKVTADPLMGELYAKECDAKGVSAKKARKEIFYISEFCGAEDCRPTIREIFNEAQKTKSTSTLPAGVYAKCVDMKTSLGVTTPLANCN